VPHRDRVQRFFIILFPGSIQMSMRAQKANRPTSWGELPGPADIAAAANRGRPNEAGDPSRIRTCNPRSRNPLLYPVELWDRNFRTLTFRTLGLHSIANMKNPLSSQARSEPFCAPKRQSPGGPWLSARPARHAAPRPVFGRLASTNQGSLRHMLHATFSPPLPAPSVRHLFAHFFTSRGFLSAAQGAPS
jgi:hypothetical protein